MVLAPIVLATLLSQSTQDAEGRYREALYQEVDKGDLDKAVELYGKVEADASAPEAVRAKALFRRAWCLEKKGQKVEAERAYREVTTRYAGQTETAAKARERLDHVVTGNGAATPAPSMDERISGLILEIGSDDRDVRVRARRSLVLLGEKAVPALRQALNHKDVTLSTTAASILVELEQDSGTYSVLLRGVLEAYYYVEEDAVSKLNTLLRRQQGYRRDFIEAFRKETDPYHLDRLLALRSSAFLPELRDRLRDLLLTGTEHEFDRAATFLAVTDEAELLGLLARLEKADPESADARARALLWHASGRVKDDRAFTKSVARILYIDDNPNRGETTWTMLTKFASPRALLEGCGETWLRVPGEELPHILWKALDDVGNDSVRWSCSMLGRDLPDSRRKVLLGHIEELIGKVTDAEDRKTVEETLWSAAGKETGELKAPALRGLAHLLPESNPRWEELVRLMLTHLLLLESNGPMQETKARLVGGTIILEEKAVSDIGKWFRARTTEGQKRMRAILNELVLSKDEKVSGRAMTLEVSIGDDSRFEVFGRVASDESRSLELRFSALDRMSSLATEFAQVREPLSALVKDKSPRIRAWAAKILSRFRSPEVDALLAPLVTDPDREVGGDVIHYFEISPRIELLDPLIQALKSPHDIVRQRAALALGKTESVKAAPHLIAVLEDADPEVRNAARQGLEAIKRHQEEVQKWKSWYDGVKDK